MKIVVTGGAGFIGANLCRTLMGHQDVEVVVIDDLSTGKRENLASCEVDLRVASILDLDAVRAATCGAHSIVHLAAVGSVPRSIVDPAYTHAVNVTGTLNVLEAARAAGAQVVFASSSAVYGRNPAQPKSETMAVEAASPYAASKAAGECYVRSYQESFGLAAMVFRFFNVFGPLQGADHDYAAVIPAFASAALRGEALTVYGDGEQSRDFVYVQTVADLLAQAALARRDHAGPVNLAWGSSITLNALIDLLSGILQAPVRARYQPERAGDIRHSQAASSLLRAMFPTIEQIPLESALRSTVAWMAAEVAAAASAGPAA